MRFCFAAQRGEFAEQRGVGFRRVVRLPALVAQVLQKIFDERVHCFAGFAVNSTNRLLCSASVMLSDLASPSCGKAKL